MQRRKTISKLASMILDNRVSELFPHWVAGGCPYVERIINNFKDHKDPFDGFGDYELQDALAFCIYVRTNMAAPEKWDPVEESAEMVEQGVIQDKTMVHKYLCKYISDLLPPVALAKDFNELKGMIHFDPKQGHGAFFRKK